MAIKAAILQFMVVSGAKRLKLLSGLVDDHDRVLRAHRAAE
jgi:hypothetical protein